MSARWRGRVVLITSGPTREPLDPIRFLTNASSGRMGWALARAAMRLGARAIVVSGPTEVPPPRGAEVHRVRTALEMLRRVRALRKKADVVIGAAAVSDWRFARAAAHKIKRSDGGTLRLTLRPNPDIIKEVARGRRGGRPVVVGFALETRRRIESAREKLARKGLDLVVANGPSSLAGGRSQAALVRRDGRVVELPPLSKDRVARAVLKEIEPLL